MYIMIQNILAHDALEFRTQRISLEHATFSDSLLP